MKFTQYALLLFALPASMLSRSPSQSAPVCTGSPVLEGYAMTYDASRQMVLIFGGAGTNGALSGEMWGWDGLTWACVSGASEKSPPPRSAAMLAYDAERQTVVLYGGRVGRDGLRDTWELTSTGWTRKNANGPTPEPHGVMAFDANAHAVLLYNALGDDTPARATWRWTGTEWIKVVSEPAAEFPNAMFPSNGSRPALLMTARSSGVPDAFNARLYEWKNAQWKLVTTSGIEPVFSPQAPAARTTAGGLLFTGFEANGAVNTFVLVGTAWRKYAGASPPRRRGALMVFDARRGVVVLHAGEDGSRLLNDTWEWSGQEWRKIR